jgi:hypothetical protein
VKLSKRFFAVALLALASLPVAAQVTDTYVVPVSANVRGAFGTHWMTRFSVFNPHLDRDLTISITWLPSGGAQGIEELVTLPPNALAYSDNLLDALFGVNNGSGALLVATFPEDNPGIPDRIADRAFMVNSETFNNHPSGTYGQTIEGEWIGLLDYDSDPISSVAHGIRNSGIHRTNIGAANLGRCSVTLYMNVYDADGETVRSDIPLVIPPLSHWQEALPVSVTNGSVEFFLVDPCAADDDRYAVVFPYTSTVDQRTGDPSYQYPKLLANPSVFAAKGRALDTLNVGKKIDTSYARQVRAGSARGGTARLNKTEKGWEIVR